MATFNATSTEVLPSSEKKNLEIEVGSSFFKVLLRSMAGLCVNPAKITCSN
jgi:hypothetical protein